MFKGLDPSDRQAIADLQDVPVGDTDSLSQDATADDVDLDSLRQRTNGDDAFVDELREALQPLCVHRCAPVLTPVLTSNISPSARF